MKLKIIPFLLFSFLFFVPTKSNYLPSNGLSTIDALLYGTTPFAILNMNSIQSFDFRLMATESFSVFAIPSQENGIFNIVNYIMGKSSIYDPILSCSHGTNCIINSMTYQKNYKYIAFFIENNSTMNNIAVSIASEISPPSAFIDNDSNTAFLYSLAVDHSTIRYLEFGILGLKDLIETKDFVYFMLILFTNILTILISIGFCIVCYRIKKQREFRTLGNDDGL